MSGGYFMFGERGYLGLVQTWYHGPTQFDSLSFLGKQNHIGFVWSGLSRSADNMGGQESKVGMHHELAIWVWVKIWEVGNCVLGHFQAANLPMLVENTLICPTMK